MKSYVDMYNFDILPGNSDYVKRAFGNQLYIKKYLDENKLSINELILSSHAYNTLKLNQIHKLSDVLFLSKYSLSRLKYITESIVNEILRACSFYIRSNKDVFEAYIDSYIQQSAAISESATELSIDEVRSILTGVNKEEVKKELARQNVLVEQLNLSTRAYNVLKRNRINSLLDALDYYPDKFSELKNIGNKTVEEINRTIEEFISRMLAFDRTSETGFTTPPTVPSEPETVRDALMNPLYREKAFDYIRLFDVPISAMHLSVRTYHAMVRENLTTLSRILTRYPFDSTVFPGVGAKSIAELSHCVEDLLIQKDKGLLFYLNDDMDSLYSEDSIKDEILNSYNQDPYHGYSLSDFVAMMGDKISEQKIKHVVGTLLAENKLEYVDYRCYKVYLSFYTYLREYIEHSDGQERSVDALKLLYEGKTLEEIAKVAGITRERVRQLAARELNKLREAYLNSYNTEFFDEDFYSYFFETYSVNKECWVEYIGIDENAYVYLKRSYKRGKDASFEHILSDEKVPASIKIRIMDFIQKDTVVIDGQSFPPQRSIIEEYIITTYCKEDTKWDDFVCLYNDVLKRNRVPFDEKIYITDANASTRYNTTSDALCCLWKSGKTLRAYSINSKDYTKLLESIGIANYQNTGISTLKWFNDFPEIMEEYDIRDQYELHNLLKKIIANGSYNNIHFDRQPGIVFGDFDRDAVMYELMVSNAPISRESLADIVYDLFGYDRGSCMANYFLCIDKYYHDGFYSIDFKPISDENAGYLKSVLTEDFYYVSEVQKIYLDLFPEADIQEINPRSLKMLGFQHFTNYVLKNCHSASEFFTNLLTREEVFNYQTIRNKFTYVSMFTQTCMDLRKNYDIFLFGNGQAISFKRLQRLGITKQTIIDYCNNVIGFAEENSYFTIHSLRERGFSDSLDELGFDDEFYEGILEVCPDIYYTKCSNTSIFICGHGNKGFQRKDFLISIINEYKSIAVDELEDLLIQDYGITLSIRLQECLAGTSVYYDSIMERFYDNKNTYYDEID